MRDPTTMQELATFLVMLDVSVEVAMAALMEHHPYETEADMQDAISLALGRKTRFEHDLRQALDVEAVQEEHRE